ncbi:hypothetical protein [Streptomyces coeruleorubidus]
MAKSKPRHRTARPVRRLVAFVDADVAKGGRVSRHQLTKGPESCQLERVGIVWARADERCLTPVGNELIDGPLAAQDTVAALERADLVVGHGLLQSDLRALAMLTPVPDARLEACVDTLVVLHQARGGQWATGLNLGDLSWHTLRTRRGQAWQRTLRSRPGPPRLRPARRRPPARTAVAAPAHPSHLHRTRPRHRPHPGDLHPGRRCPGPTARGGRFSVPPNGSGAA